MIARQTGPLARLRLYSAEASAFLHRRKLRRLPRVRLYWQDGGVSTLAPESPQSEQFLALAEELISLADPKRGSPS